MPITLTDQRRQRLLDGLSRLYEEDFDLELSSFQAERILRFFLEQLGPAIYNQAIQDARGFLQTRLDDMDAEFYEPDANT